MFRRNVLRRVALSAVLSAGALAPFTIAAPAQAFCETENEWPGSLVYVTSGGAIPNGWITTLQTSSTQWNNISGANWTVRYTASSDVHFLFKYSAPDGGFGGAPALTDLKYSGTSIVGGNIFFNPNWNWNLNGNFNEGNKLADVRTTAVHELGHEIRLAHPNQCIGSVTAEEQAAVMTPDFTKKWTINSDDKAGAAYMK